MFYSFQMKMELGPADNTLQINSLLFSFLWDLLIIIMMTMIKVMTMMINERVSLQASSGVKQWNKRWFVLTDRCLFYYKGLFSSLDICFYQFQPISNTDKFDVCSCSSLVSFSGDLIKVNNCAYIWSVTSKAADAVTICTFKDAPPYVTHTHTPLDG